MANALEQTALKFIPDAAQEGLKAFLQAFTTHIPEEDAELFDPALLASVAQTHWELASKRGTGQPEIRIYTPPHLEAKTGLRKMIIDVVSDDMAFIIDSIVAEINKNNILIDLLIHPIFYALYDEKGNLRDIADFPKEGYIRQSHVHVQIRDILTEEALVELRSGLYIALQDVYIVNHDWPDMRAQLKTAHEELAHAKTNAPMHEIAQYCAFLEYLHDHNFTLLGTRTYEFVEENGVLKSKTIEGLGRGLLQDENRPAYISDTEEGLPRNLQELRRDLPPLCVSKTNRLSTVHRRVPMDAIAIKTYDENGKVKGEKLFLGLFTSVTYSRSVSDVPYLHEKVEQVLQMSNFIPGSHDYKGLRHILEKYPRDELFQIPPQDMLKIAVSILHLQERQRIALFMRKDPFRRYVSCLVYVPRDRYGTNLRKTICSILEEELNGRCENFYTSLDDSVFARVMFIINVRQDDDPKPSADKIEKRLAEAGQTWAELLAQALAEAYNDETFITQTGAKYGEAFPVSYALRYRPKQAVFDIEKIECVLKNNALDLDLYKPEDVGSDQLRLKVYSPVNPLTLSDVMPILENLGLRAISELPFEIKPAKAESSVWVHDFLLETPSVKDPVVITDVKTHFESGFLKIWTKEMENDSLNALILSANLNADEVTILRAYLCYLKQIRLSFSRTYTEKALTDNPKIARGLVDLFKALHDPENGTKAQGLAQECRQRIEGALEKVESFDQDRILRTVMALVEATLRTNFYQCLEDGAKKPYLALKFDCAAVPDLPAPKPYREIFVYSPRVEAIHLRGDKIARGGFRWSDRHEDFRTEVLGLMKAQMVKNSIIVPMGAKGGFVVKTPTTTRAEYMAEGVACYKTFIRALLDLTDNLKGSEVIPPPNVVRRDGDDPYIVAAADKGTASFSDIANGISQEYGFWLDDAFASGGSAGYDHKKMGITAKGAWESVKLHFRALGRNIQKEDFDVIGVGDMGGDVFGNGMLLSPHIRLVGAFNHMHIFCDPDPDPATSFQERQRLFDGVLGWNEYNADVLSKGGRVFERSEKVLTLTPEIMARFDIDKDKVSPNELMQAILKARADLLWVGGIGTYIKSTAQSHGDAGDKANDAIRIDAPELRVKVLGEGANLAITQLGRIEFAQGGGKLNTDFVDNSGGVNSSDLEVNIKILLSDIMAQKEHAMDLPARNALLESMTAEVSKLVLRNNYQQAQAISLVELSARENLKIQNDFMRDLEREIGLSRTIEGLPSEAMVEVRLREGKGLTRPELCVLVSYAKIRFTQELLASDIPDSDDMADWRINYFPSALQKKYIKEIQRHRLAREIVATSMANSLVNRMGPTFLKEMKDKTGASSAQIARAYLIVRDVFGLRALWDQIEALDNKVPAQVQLEAMQDIAALARHAVLWFLMKNPQGLHIGQACESFGPRIAELQKCLEAVLPPALKDSASARKAQALQNGLPETLAGHMAGMPVYASACDIIRIALLEETDLKLTAQTYFEVGERFQMDWLRDQAHSLPSEDYWTLEAASGLVDQFYNAQAALTMRILRDMKSVRKGGETGANIWFENPANAAHQLDALFLDLRRAGLVDLPMLVLANLRLQRLAQG